MMLYFSVLYFAVMFCSLPVLRRVVNGRMEMLEHGDELEHETFEDHAENVALNDHLGHNEEDDLEEED